MARAFASSAGMKLWVSACLQDSSTACQHGAAMLSCKPACSGRGIRQSAAADYVRVLLHAAACASRACCDSFSGCAHSPSSVLQSACAQLCWRHARQPGTIHSSSRHCVIIFHTPCRTRVMRSLQEPVCVYRCRCRCLEPSQGSLPALVRGRPLERHPGGCCRRRD